MAREQRRLAAILAADVVGYSRLMGRDESGTLTRLRKNRAERLEPVLAKYGGRLVKLTGDGALIEFASAVDALSAAIEFQQAVADANRERPETEGIVFRIGLHLGDLIVDGDDLYGDGVNVAARLETEAPSGGVLISRTVHEAVVGRLKATFDDLGSLALKNIERPILAFNVKWEPSDWRPLATLEVAVAPVAASSTLAPLPLPDKPSIAVLPFQNMSGDPEQEYFADGVVEEIITALSRMRWLFVIARNSTFTYKGRAVDVKQIGRELGVRYVLEGSVRKAANRVRITGQLIDTATGAHLWADRFDGGLEDIFDLQDQVTASVVGAIAPTLEKAEIDRAKRKPTESLDAYDYYLRGLASHYKIASRQANAEALSLFNRAIELDPDFASAYGRAASCYMDRRSNGWMTDLASESAEVARLAQRAVELGKDDAIALATSGWALVYVVRDVDAGAAFIDRALVLNPNLAVAWFYGGWVKIWLGEPDAGLERLARALRLSPLDPFMSGIQQGAAHAHMFAGRYDEASRWAAMSLRDAPDYQPGLRISAASNALAGRLEQAQKMVVRMQHLNPSLRVSTLREVVGPYRRAEDLAKYERGLRKAGLPE